MTPRLLALALVALSLSSLACTDGLPEQAELVAAVHPAGTNRTADVLIVIDDSASMDDQLELLAANLRVFGEVFESGEARTDVRFAITTTSVPGPTCAGPLARGGELLTDTCNSAPAEAFVGVSELDGASLDRTEICPSSCGLDSLDLRLSPTDDYGEGLAVRPWIDLGYNSYGGNLPEGVSLGEALTCVGLRGIGGCEFESPAQAALRALGHMRDPGDPAYGFLREDTPLLIVFIGDEDDCSHPDSAATIFDPGGERVFWSDPAAPAPTSAVCHAASMACDASGCAPVDRDASGAETSDPQRAVIDPVDTLAAELDALRAEREVTVALLGGVTSVGALNWSRDADAAWIDAFGWAPGCEFDGARAQPPGRLRALAEPDFNAFSICDSDWTPVFSDIGGWIGPLYLACGPANVRDLDPSTPLLEPDCEVLARDAQNRIATLDECVREAGVYALDPETNDYRIPEGEDRCFVLATDVDRLTEDSRDDIDEACAAYGWDVQLLVAARPGSLPPPRGSTYEVVCTPAL